MERMQRFGPEFIDITWGAGGTSADLTTELVATAQSVYGLETMMHLTCTNMPVEKIDIALKVNTSMQAHDDIFSWLQFRLPRIVDVKTSLLCVVILQRVKRTGNPLKMVFRMLLILYVTFASNMATTFVLVLPVCNKGNRNSNIKCSRTMS